MHYTAGAGSVFSLTAARAVPGDGAFSVVARVLLDGAGGLFGAYLLLAASLSVYGRHLRRTAPAQAAVVAIPRSWAWTPGDLLPAGTMSAAVLVPAPRSPLLNLPRPALPRPRRGALPAPVARRGPALPPSAWPEPAVPATAWSPSPDRIPYPGRLPVTGRLP